MPAQGLVVREVGILKERGGHVLLVDDNAQLAELYQIVLEVAGYTVTLAGDWAQGLVRYREALEHHHPFSLVMLDLHIPFLCGWQTLEVLLSMHGQALILVTTGM